MKTVTVNLLNHGGYDGMKHLAFPIQVTGVLLETLGYVNVPMSELLRIGYSTEAGGLGEIPDSADMTEPMPFMISWGEAEVVEAVE